ncbi:MAG: tRNA-uridine aminocarboxypropyltransferase [Kofleriaceae bacterium]
MSAARPGARVGDGAADEPAGPRALCARCRRPPRVCYCHALPRLPTRTRVVILQHPRERDMPIGTARMASLCLPSASLHVGMRWDDDGQLAALLADPARPPVLLYPAEGARDILQEPPPGPVTLVVVDGTWSQAKNVVRDNAVLRSLPRYAFVAPALSQYRIRREPRDEYVSTIEALMYVLGALEGDAPRFAALLEPLRAMVDAQLAANEGTPRFRRRRRVPGPNGPRVPEAVRARWDDLVCVVGESNAWPFREGVQRYPEELVHWMAERVATGERVSLLAAPSHPLAPNTPFHIELPAQVIEGGGPRAALAAEARAFLRPRDLLCGWGHHSANLLATTGELAHERLDLRAATQRLRNVKLGTLEDVGRALFGEEPLVAAGPGRAGRRLGILSALVRSWRGEAGARAG